ncbi:hypothetical protein QYE76_025407 [Lolium multiflorum]|uniref:Integrase catalytic domain-containing protein n=1 Tax=Lolium multiflorum TaxID=4521 RepID=A0AAD8RED0_LOLMU|nr:hypothetical protein QYE76_025407 [Lolium multiflorum]
MVLDPTIGTTRRGVRFSRVLIDGRSINILYRDTAKLGIQEAELRPPHRLPWHRARPGCRPIGGSRRFRMKLNPAKCTFGVPAGQLLGYLVSQRGIEANRRRSADEAFRDLKRVLSTAPILASPASMEPMLLYIDATNRVVSVVLVVERKEDGKEAGRSVGPARLLSQVCRSAKLPPLQKVTYGVYMAAKKLKHYFRNTPSRWWPRRPWRKSSAARTPMAGCQVGPGAGRPHHHLRATHGHQVADPRGLLRRRAEMQYLPPVLIPHWKLHFDGSKMRNGLGAGIVVTSPKGDRLDYVLIHFAASNNVAEYEALIHGLKLAKEIGWIEAKPIKKLDGSTAVTFLKEIIVRYGYPHSIITDNGSNFAEGIFKRYCGEMGIRMDLSSVAHPESNGQVEKANGLILRNTAGWWSRLSARPVMD